MDDGGHWNDGYGDDRVQVRASVSPQLRQEIQKLSRSTGRTISDTIEIALERYILENAAERPKLRHAKAVTLPPLPEKPVVAPSCDDVMDMIERGFTASQVATIKRMPYKAVLAEIAAYADLHGGQI